MPDQNGTVRLDRIEHALELLIADHVQFREEHAQFRQEHKQLLTAQVVLTDRLDRFIQASGETIAELAEAGKHTDQRLNALITIVDGIIHRPRPEP